MQTSWATSELKRSFKNSDLKLGQASRFLQLMAKSPASLRAYIRADAALVRGQLTGADAPRVGIARSKNPPGHASNQVHQNRS